MVHTFSQENSDQLTQQTLELLDSLGLIRAQSKPYHRSRIHKRLPNSLPRKRKEIPAWFSVNNGKCPDCW